MAVLQDVPGVKVSICINGADCPEYDDPDISEQQRSCPTSSKYIESSDNVEFTIRIIVDQNYDWGNTKHSLCFGLEIDSHPAGSRIFNRSQLANGYGETVIHGKYVFCNNTSTWFNHAFKFSTVKIVENQTKERLNKDQRVARALGSIDVKVRRVTKARKSLSNVSYNRFKSSSFELAEKALKGKSISHGTILSAGTAITRPNYVHTKSLPGEDGPFAIFRFQYRSRGALQDEMIIPRTPPRSPSLNGLSQAEITRLAKERLKDIEEKKQLVKKEPKGTKREMDESFGLDKNDLSARPIKTRRRQSASVIDLTDD
ncbi:hypothetical protein F4811DRAFT_390568 [Daldinia bambusicola]|nr:hypothetical protein F4811DRAFT_390568 [Daldinia bambusicola]